MKEEILKCISKGGVSFVELSREVPNFTGDYQWGNANNWIYWSGMSEEAIIAMKELQEDKIIDGSPCQQLLYICDGGWLDLPLVKSNRTYKHRHWIPLTWNLVK